MPKSSLTCPAILSLALCGAGVAPAQDDATVEDETQRCLNARSIRGADVIDDNRVVFEIQGRRLFLNTLPRSCVGLSQDRRFSYDLYTRSLCARDKIRILKEAGNTFYEGKSCALGRFQPITPEELQAILGERAPEPEPEKREPADIEDVTEEGS